MKSRVHQLFGQALDRPEAARTQWLRAQCGDDHALLDAVVALLKADAEAGVLDRDVAAWAEPLITGGHGAEHDAQHVGAGFGPYVVKRLLGRGGMGSVWLAERRDGAFQQQVAIKLIAGALPSEEALQRFTRERQILVRLSHPNIARVLDGGTVGGTPWFAMDYVDGLPLDVYAGRHGFGIAQKLALFKKIVAAVQFAHQNLVVHRDLKPSNILVDAQGEPRLLDFGVAKLVGDEGSEATFSRAPLSMAYAAPEQVAGAAITTATDIYSLGVVLYELLSGTRPHRRGGGPLAMAQAITDTDAEPPSRVLAQTTRDARRIRGDLDTIALKCLQRDPVRRYASAQALADDIDAFLRQRPIRARPESFGYRTAKFARRHPFGVALGTLATVAVLGLSVYSMLKAREAEHERVVATAQAERATAVQTFLVGLFEQQRPDVALGAGISAKDLLDRAELRLADGAALTPDTRLALLGTLAGLRYDLSDFEAALRLDEAAVEVAEKHFGRGSEQHALALIERSDALQQIGRSKEAIADCDAAMPMLKSSLAALDARIMGVIDCAAMLRNSGDLDAAKRLLDEAGTMFAASGANTGRLRRALLRAQTRLAFSSGDHVRVVALSDELIALLRADPATPPSDLATALHTRAGSAQLTGRASVAIADYREALALHRRIFGPRHHLTIGTQGSLAVLLYEIGETDEAGRLQDEALKLARETLGADSPALALAISDAAVQAYVRRDYAGAATLLEESIAINVRAFGPAHVDTLALMNNLSSIQRKLGRFDEARATAERVIAHASADDAGTAHQVRQAHARLAVRAEAVGDWNELERQARWMVDAIERSDTAQASELPEALAFLAVAQMRLGRPSALDTAQRLESVTRASLEPGTGPRLLYLSYLAWLELESGDAQQALDVSDEILGDAPIAAASWNRIAQLQAAIVHLRALHALGRHAETAPWHDALIERRRIAAADEAPHWQSVEALLSPRD